MSEREQASWSVYLLRRGDGGLYTGISTDVARRFEEHRSGRGARSLRGKTLVGVVFSLELGSRSLATRVERRVKRLGKADKEALVASGCSTQELLQRLDLAGS